MKKQIKEQIVDDGVREKMANLLNTLKNTANNIENDWNSKERENYIYNQVKLLNFVEDGEFILKDKSIVNSLKKAYHSKNLGEFTTKTLSDYFNGVDENLIYILKEPFGSKASPDILFITSKGVVWVEDKSSKNGKVSFDTLGKMFYIVLKSRESDVIFKDIFIEDVGVKDKEKYRDKPEQVTESIDIPFFKKEEPKLVDDVTFEPPAPKLASPQEAFGAAFNSPEAFSFSQPSEEDEGMPF